MSFLPYSISSQASLLFLSLPYHLLFWDFEGERFFRKSTFIPKSNTASQFSKSVIFGVLWPFSQKEMSIVECPVFFATSSSVIFFEVRADLSNKAYSGTSLFIVALTSMFISVSYRIYIASLTLPHLFYLPLRGIASDFPHGSYTEATLWGLGDYEEDDCDSSTEHLLFSWFSCLWIEVPPLYLYALSDVGVVFLSHAPENYRCLLVSHGENMKRQVHSKLSLCTVWYLR